jgi:hypothetical protein
MATATPSAAAAATVMTTAAAPNLVSIVFLIFIDFSHYVCGRKNLGTVRSVEITGYFLLLEQAKYVIGLGAWQSFSCRDAGHRKRRPLQRAPWPRPVPVFV